MPNTEPMSGTEMTRAVTDIKAMLTAVNVKLDKIPDWDDINRLETRRDHEQDKQDEAIKSVETKVTAVDNRVSGLMLAVLISMLGTAGSIISSLF